MGHPSVGSDTGTVVLAEARQANGSSPVEADYKKEQLSLLNRYLKLKEKFENSDPGPATTDMAWENGSSGIQRDAAGVTVMKPLEGHTWSAAAQKDYNDKLQQLCQMRSDLDPSLRDLVDHQSSYVKKDSSVGFYSVDQMMAKGKNTALNADQVKLRGIVQDVDQLKGMEGGERGLSSQAVAALKAKYPPDVQRAVENYKGKQAHLAKVISGANGRPDPSAVLTARQEVDTAGKAVLEAAKKAPPPTGQGDQFDHKKPSAVNSSSPGAAGSQLTVADGSDHSQGKVNSFWDATYAAAKSQFPGLSDKQHQQIAQEMWESFRNAQKPSSVQKLEPTNIPSGTKIDVPDMHGLIKENNPKLFEQLGLKDLHEQVTKKTGQTVISV